MINERYAHSFCKDDIAKIENYEQALNDNTQTWHCHHRLELTVNGEFAHTRSELIRANMYYARPYFELIFLTHRDHAALHSNKSALSGVTRKKLSDSHKCKSSHMLGKTHTSETKQKISAKLKGSSVSAETKQKISATLKGRQRPDSVKRKIAETLKRRNKLEMSK